MPPQVWGELDLLPPNLGGWGGDCVSPELLNKQVRNPDVVA